MVDAGGTKGVGTDGVRDGTTVVVCPASGSPLSAATDNAIVAVGLGVADLRAAGSLSGANSDAAAETTRYITGKAIAAARTVIARPVRAFI